MILIYTTFPDRACAESVCTALIDNNIIKCANISDGGTSIYKWDGEINTKPEVFAYLKTTEDLFDEVDAHFQEHHPYTTYCLIQIEPKRVNQDYLDWIEN